MSAVGAKAAQASAGIADLEAALDKTQQALKSVEKVDQVAATARRRGKKFVKLLLIATVVGVTIVVAKKLMGGSGAPPATDPYGSTSTDN